MSQNAQTQRILVTEPTIENHEYRIQHLEDGCREIKIRLTNVEQLHNALNKITTTVELLNDRVRLLLWVGGVVAGGIILSVIGAVTYILTGQR